RLPGPHKHPEILLPCSRDQDDRNQPRFVNRRSLTLQLLFLLLVRHFLDKALLGLAFRDDEMVVVAVVSPRPRRHVTHFDKLPVGDIGGREAEIIANRGRNVETGATVQIRFGTFVLENVLKMVGPERAAIFPLGVTGLVSFANRDPVVLANGPARLGVGLLKPGDDQRRFRFELAMGYVVVGKRAVKWILSRNE